MGFQKPHFLAVCLRRPSASPSLAEATFAVEARDDDVMSARAYGAEEAFGAPNKLIGDQVRSLAQNRSHVKM